jgi:hypothetical protein
VFTAGTIVAGFTAAVAAQQPTRPPDGAARSVTLPLAEYNRLLDLAARPPAPPTTAPVGAVLTNADLRVRVERESAQGQFTLTGEVLREGVNRVGVLSGATLVGGAISGRPLPLVADSTGQTALLQGVGPFALSLEWGAPLVFQPGRASFTLPVPPSGTARTIIDIPGDQADVHLSAGLITRRTAADGRTVIEATLRPGTSTEVWWTMRDSAPVAATREVRTVADVMTLVTIGDSDVRMVALVDVTVVQGEPRTVDVRLPAGYEITSVSGASLESSDPREGGVTMTVSDPALRRHQFLVSLERPHEAGSFRIDTGVVTLPDVQRERGEIAVEGVGTLELDAAEREGMHRIDVRELNPALQSLARTPILSAFRYQRGTAAAPGLTLDVKRFTDAGVLAAVADRGVATTMITSEGRALTEVSLQVRNRAQPFLKLTLPAGATLASVEVADQPAKPVLGADGIRVPLLRPGFRPAGPYSVSFVYMHAGTPFGRKGDLQMSLPKMDLPVGIIEWEVFVPENYSAKIVDGNVIDRRLVVRSIRESMAAPIEAEAKPSVRSGAGGATGGVVGGVAGGVADGPIGFAAGLPGQIRGRVTDSTGAVIPGALVGVDVAGSHLTATSGPDGSYLLSGVPSGLVEATVSLPGFVTLARTFDFDQRPRLWNPVMRVGALEETVSVSGATPTASSVDKDERRQAPSQNVVNLQRRAAGVLPIRLDIPRAGTSHQFVKPLVVEQDTTVTLRYKRR